MDHRWIADAIQMYERWTTQTDEREISSWSVTNAHGSRNHVCDETELSAAVTTLRLLELHPLHSLPRVHLPIHTTFRAKCPPTLGPTFKHSDVIFSCPLVRLPLAITSYPAYNFFTFSCTDPSATTPVIQVAEKPAAKKTTSSICNSARNFPRVPDFPARSRIHPR